jgi:hypothetical protein
MLVDGQLLREVQAQRGRDSDLSRRRREARSGQAAGAVGARSDGVDLEPGRVRGPWHRVSLFHHRVRSAGS